MSAQVSVIIAVRDMAALLPLQLHALSQQTQSDFEIVVIDNGSRDDVQLVIDEWTDRLPELRTIFEPEVGISAARNRGVQVATGDLILCCDADDRVAPGWVEAMRSALARHDFVAGGKVRGVSDGLIPPARQPRVDLTPYLDFLPFADGCSAGYRRGALESVGGWDEFTFSGHGAVDVDLSWRLQIAGFTLGYAPEATVYKRARSTSAEDFAQSWRWGVREVVLYQRFAQHGIPRRYRILLDLWKIVRTAYRLLRPRRRATWIRLTARTFGRVAASMRHRTWYA